MAEKIPTSESKLRALYTFPPVPSEGATSDEIEQYNKLVEEVQIRIDKLSSGQLSTEATAVTKRILIGGKIKR